MAHPVIMPRQGQSVESCILAKWHKAKGEKVTSGDLLFTYETDKSTFEETAKNDGALLEIFADEGDDVPCLQNVCVIGQPGEDVSSYAPDGQGSQVDDSNNQGERAQKNDALPEQNEVAAIKTEHSELSTVYTGGSRPISPRAKKLAKRAGVDPALAIPTGPNGRIIERDIESVKGTVLMTPFTPEDDVKRTVPLTQTFETFVKHSLIRKTIAKAMHASLQNTAQLTLNSTFDATDIQNWRKKLKENAAKYSLPNITIGDILIYATSRVLQAHPEINAHYEEEGIRQFSSANIGVAVDTQRGLMVPTLFDASNQSIAQISAEVRRMAEACKAGSISPDELTGGTFTITNLGAFGIESFTPVINPPQVAILGCCSIVERVSSANGSLHVYPAMGLSLTFDHRAVDGAPAARFLADLCKYLENFSVLVSF